MRSVRLISTTFACDLVQTEDGATVASIISKHAEFRCFMQAITGTYPVAAYLKRIGNVPTNECSFCSSQQRETFNHFKRICPRFHDARVAAHNKICECLSEARRNCGRKVLPKGWVLYEEPVFYSHCKITVLDIIRPSDIWREWLQTAHQDKLRTYEPLCRHCRAISNYADSNWEI